MSEKCPTCGGECERCNEYLEEVEKHRDSLACVLLTVQARFEALEKDVDPVIEAAMELATKWVDWQDACNSDIGEEHYDFTVFDRNRAVAHVIDALANCQRAKERKE